MKAETVFRKQVWAFLQTLTHSWFTAVQQVAIRGTPDYIGCCRGLFVGLELKTDTGRVAPLQTFTAQKIYAAKGLALFVRPGNWAAVKAQLTSIDKGTYNDPIDSRRNIEPYPQHGFSEAEWPASEQPARLQNQKTK